MPPHKIPLTALFGYPERDLPQFSPNGAFFTFVAPDGDTPPTLWIAQDPHASATCLLPSNTHPLTQYAWAHTNEHIIFLRDHEGDENWQLHVLDITTGEATNIMPRATMRVQSFATSPANPDVITVIMNARDRSLYDVFTYNIRTKRLTIMARNDGTVKNWILDPEMKVRGKVVFDANGTFYLFARRSVRSKWFHAHTWEKDDTFTSGPLSFSPDGRYLYLTDAHETNTCALVALDTTTGEKVTLAHDADFDLYLGASLQDLIPPLSPHQTLLHAPNGKLIGFSYYRERLTWHFFPEVPESLTPLHDILITDHYQSWIESETDHVIILGRCNDDEPVSYWKYDRASGNLSELCATAPTLTTRTLAQKQAVSFPSRDGLTIHGYLTLPPGKQSAPLVVKIHGGPWARDTASYQADVQFLADRGYGCLQVNYRGSSGYGKAFINAGNKEWGGRMVDDVVDGALWACEQGYTDKSSMALMGRSYGGYAALCAASRYPDLFTCLVAEVPPTHLPRVLETLPQHWHPFVSDFHQRLGHPTKDRKKLVSFSPALNADKLTLPLLISHGLHDVRVAHEQTERLLSALGSTPQTVTVLSFPNEGHQSRRFENIVTYHEEVEKFLSQFLPLHS